MTKREAEAIRLIREYSASRIASTYEPESITDEYILKLPNCKMLVEAMQWQAEQYSKVKHKIYAGSSYYDKENDVMLNAGTEEI